MEKYNSLTRTVKNIHDSIHDYIPLSNFAVNIIDTKLFQRLRHLKQLGVCYIVFPNAVHTRFEHSIGTYYLANTILARIVLDTKKEELNKYVIEIKELHNYFTRTYGSVEKGQFDNYVIELIKIAALCHDIGHGPFSHTFDHFLHNFKYEREFEHEYRSGMIVEKIISENLLLSELVQQDEINFIKNLINPHEDNHKGFIYQIVSNNFNSLDVDKYDYLMRDMQMIYGSTKINIERLINFVKIHDNNIIYLEQSYADISELFHIRKKLHEEIYCHKSVISCQKIIVDLLMEINKVINIVDKFTNLDFFVKLTDNMILEFSNFLKLLGFSESFTEKIKLCELSDMIDKHILYPFIEKKINKKYVNFKEKLIEYCKTDKLMNEYYLNIIIHQNRILSNQ